MTSIAIIARRKKQIPHTFKTRQTLLLIGLSISLCMSVLIWLSWTDSEWLMLSSTGSIKSYARPYNHNLVQRNRKTHSALSAKRPELFSWHWMKIGFCERCILAHRLNRGINQINLICTAGGWLVGLGMPDHCWQCVFLSSFYFFHLQKNE